MLSSTSCMNIILIFFLSYAVVSEGLTIRCTNTTTSTTNTLTVATIEGRWSSWSSCEGKCGEGTKTRTKSCLVCNTTYPSRPSKVCNSGTNVTVYGDYSQWVSINDSLSDKVRSRQRCVTSIPGCEYIEEWEHTQACASDYETIVFKVAPNSSYVEEGWRLATASDVQQYPTQTRKVLDEKRKLNHTYYKWMVCRLEDGYSIGANGYGYKIFNQTAYNRGWGQQLLIQLDILYTPEDNKWSDWSSCDIESNKCSEKEKYSPKCFCHGHKARRRTCVKRDWSSGKGCNFTAKQQKADDKGGCSAGLNATYHGTYGVWSEWKCKGNCGKDKEIQLRNRTSCSIYDLTSPGNCTYLMQFEERKGCDAKDEKDNAGPSVRLKIMASCGTWAVLLCVFVINAFSLRHKEKTAKKAVRDHNINVESSGGIPDEKATPSTSQQQQDDEEVAFEMADRVSDPLLLPPVTEES